MPSGTNPDSPPLRPSLTLREVAETLRCSERTVRNLINSGDLSGFHLGRGTRVLRVTPAALAAYIDAKTVVSGKAA